MLLGVALLLGVGGLIGGVGILLPRMLRPQCPVCMRRTAELVDRRRAYVYAIEGRHGERPLDDKDRSTFYEARFRCRPCKVTLIQRDGRPLVLEEALKAGIQPIPAATVVDRT
jgi:hypothetical protein